MATIESIVEAFARGLASVLVEQVQTQTNPRAKDGGRRRRRGATPPAEPPTPEAIRNGVSTGGHVEPPVTQAELDHMERVLKGEIPSDLYMPGEGVPVTGPNP